VASIIIRGSIEDFIEASRLVMEPFRSGHVFVEIARFSVSSSRGLNIDL
jgi:hypothetical protein